MGQLFITADKGDPAEFIERLVPGDIKGLKTGEMRYSVLLNDNGGVVDDLIITRFDEKTLFVVVNAGCKLKDIAYIKEQLGDKIKLEHLKERALLALQGPLAKDVIAKMFPQAIDLTFMHMGRFEYKGREVFISRSGYTGEDGFEISVAAEQAAALAEELLSFNEVRWIGLGARDSLRLEAGLCLWGHDLNESITPVEASLKWTVAKRRRDERNFKGADIILRQLENGTDKLRVGISPQGKAPLREGVELFSLNGDKIGIITSGGFSPSLEVPIAMGYIDSAFLKTNIELKAILRGREIPCKITPLPFIKQNYNKKD